MFEWPLQRVLFINLGQKLRLGNEDVLVSTILWKGKNIIKVFACNLKGFYAPLQKWRSNFFHYGPAKMHFLKDKNFWGL